MATDPPFAFDIDFVRGHFPALETPWALFDNAGGSVPARGVIERMADHMARLPVQLGASYELSVRAREAVEAGREAAAQLLNASRGEIVFGPSSTILVGILARALRPLWKEGDEVVVTNLDHETNIGPWRELEATGIHCREWGLRPESGELFLDDLEPLLNERTRLVAFTHCSNIVGTIQDVRAISARIREAGALSCVDGVAFAPHRRVDVVELGVDFYFASLYKVYGPHLAVLFGRRELLEEARGQNHFFVSEEQVPVKLEPGNVSYELAACLPGITAYLEGLAQRHAVAPGLSSAFDLIATREAKLVGPLLAFIGDHPRCRVLGRPCADPAERVPTVSFTVEGMRSSEVVERLEKHRVAVRFGHFYAYRVIDTLGLMECDGAVRASLLHYNTEDEVQRLIGALEGALT